MEQSEEGRRAVDDVRKVRRETTIMCPEDHCEDSGFHFEQDEKLSESTEQRKSTT